MPSPHNVERALSLVPQCDEFRPFVQAIVGASQVDPQLLWATAGEYSTLATRVLDANVLREQVPVVVERARARLQQLLSLTTEAIIAQQNGDFPAAARRLIEAGEVEEAEKNLEGAERFYVLASRMAQDRPDQAAQVLSLRRLGRIARAAGRLDEAWLRYQQSYQLAVEAGDVSGQAIACQGLGNICDDRGERQAAATWYERGLEVARERNDPELVWPFFTNLAALAIQDEELERAEAMLRQAREAIDAANDATALLFWHNNQGLILQARNDHAAAEALYRDLLERTRDPFWLARLRLNLGRSLVRQNRLFEACEQARRAEELAIAHRLVSLLVDAYQLLGEIATVRRDEEGFVFYQQALDVCRMQGLPRVRFAEVHLEYGRYLRSCGRPDEARAYLGESRSAFAELQLARESARVQHELDELDAAGIRESLTPENSGS